MPKTKRQYRYQLDVDAVSAPTGILRDPKLSLKAKGLLGVLLSLKNPSLRNAEAHVTDGQYAVREAARELRKKGYLKYERLRDAEGKFYCLVTLDTSPTTATVETIRENREVCTVVQTDRGTGMSVTTTTEDGDNAKASKAIVSHVNQAGILVSPFLLESLFAVWQDLGANDVALKAVLAALTEAGLRTPRPRRLDKWVRTVAEDMMARGSTEPKTSEPQDSGSHLMEPDTL